MRPTVSNSAADCSSLGGLAEVQHHVVRREVEVRGVDRIEQKRAVLGQDVAQAVSQDLDVVMACRIRAAVDDRVDVGRIVCAGKSARARHRTVCSAR